MDGNSVEGKCESTSPISLEDYLEKHCSKITQDSERLFVTDFLFPVLGAEHIGKVIPQYQFIDSEGRSRRIDFGLVHDKHKIAFEIDGETYHAEGAVDSRQFDDGLLRQNEILLAGWNLLRFSYSQLQDADSRQKVSFLIQTLIRRLDRSLMAKGKIEPTYLQRRALDALDYSRKKGWRKGIVVLPTGTGKTFLSALDSLSCTGRILFITHRIDILKQSQEAFTTFYKPEQLGLLTGDEKVNLQDSKVLFASKDSLLSHLDSLSSKEFEYVIVDEVHHGQAVTFKRVIEHFSPSFYMLGLTATPDRQDRKDIFELFDYQNAFEYDLHDAIDEGFLVPYTYYGLKDNIDYSKIRHNGKSYNINDLNKKLIIEERNQRIFEEYLDKGGANKAIGFCCSIEHAEAMESFFSERGVKAKAITSNTQARDDALEKFRTSQITVVFTVDLFNEGVDFPDVRTLLFLRPTESKTIFQQQLGRGLRLCGTKDTTVVIDFIGNYKKANSIRKYLTNGKNEKSQISESKGIYHFNPKCKVIFDAEVEEILDSQDMKERKITREDLISDYFRLVEELSRKPSQNDIKLHSEFSLASYLNEFGGWTNFLKQINEHTESSYHFPQGTHLGHILYILKHISSGTESSSNIAEQFIKFEGGFSEGKLGGFERQTKYKLQAMMELGLLVDYRSSQSDEVFGLKLTEDGEKVCRSLHPFFRKVDISVKREADGDRSWQIRDRGQVEDEFKHFLIENTQARTLVRSAFTKMDAVNLLLRYLYSEVTYQKISKSELYESFFEAPFVAEYLDRQGIDTPPNSTAVRRIPFILGLVEALGAVEIEGANIRVVAFVPTPQLLLIEAKETIDIGYARLKAFKKYIDNGSLDFSNEEISKLREKFGREFLTSNYPLTYGDI